MTANVYSLTGESKPHAHDSGLVNAEWFLADVDPARLRELQQRSNSRALIDLARLDHPFRTRRRSRAAAGPESTPRQSLPSPQVTRLPPLAASG